MRYRPPSVVIVKRLAALLLMALAGGTVLSASSARADCRPLAAEAEQAFGIPPGILQAVALAESGVAGTAWPWTINASGRPFYLDSYAEALAVAEAARKRYGTRVAVGCMQVYLRYHGSHFRDLRQMLDPRVNVHYAATFLLALRRDHGSWEAAVRHYHASDPVAQVKYLCRVLAIRRDLGYQGTTAAMHRLCDGPATTAIR